LTFCDLAVKVLYKLMSITVFISIIVWSQILNTETLQHGKLQLGQCGDGITCYRNRVEMETHFVGLELRWVWAM